MKTGFSEQLFAKFSGRRLFCGFSGGADSTAALLLASDFKERFGFTVEAVHFNHHLRGEESDREAADAAAFARKRGIPFRCVDLAVEGAGSIENAARKARLEAWKKLAEPQSAVVLGHHGGDRRENLLIRLLRGANSWGLSSMRAISRVGGITFLRPLLRNSREEIEDFLRARGVASWAQDSSNDSTKYLRNYLRNKVLPELESRVPGSLKGLDRSLLALEADADFIRDYVDRLEGDRSSVAFWKRQPAAVKIRLLRELTGAVPDGELLARLDDALEHVSGELLKIPVNADTVIQLRNDTIEAAPACAGGPPPEFRWDWRNTPRIRRGNWEFTATFCAAAEKCGPDCAFFDAERLPKILEIGPVRPGERMIPFGSDREKKIKKLRTDRGIPADAFCPVVRGKGEVYWAVMVRHSDRAKVTGTTAKTVKLQFKTFPPATEENVPPAVKQGETI